MMKLIEKLVILFLLTGIAVACGSSRKLATSSSSEILCEGFTADGHYLVSVSQAGTNVEAAVSNARKEAVRQIMFNGLKPASGTVFQKPMLTDPSAAASNDEYFKKFFADGGPYFQFTSIPKGHTPTPVKTGKGYKVKTLVAVDKDSLRKQLEKDGIINSLSSGF